MALIDREQALSHPFANGQYDKEHADEHFIMGFEDYKEWLEDLPIVEAIPKSEYKTDLKIILNRLKVRMKDRDEDNGGEPLNAVDRGYHLAYEHLCEEIDNLLKENEDGKID